MNIQSLKEHFGKHKKKYLIGLSLLVIGLVLYFVWLKPKKAELPAENQPLEPSTPNNQATTSGVANVSAAVANTPVANQPAPTPVASDGPAYITGANTTSPVSFVNCTDNFPLKKGSCGDKVKQVQKFMMAKYGGSTMGSYGADGKWGNTTDKAIREKLMRDNISATLYAKLNFGGKTIEQF